MDETNRRHSKRQIIPAWRPFPPDSNSEPGAHEEYPPYCKEKSTTDQFSPSVGQGSWKTGIHTTRLTAGAGPLQLSEQLRDMDYLKVFQEYIVVPVGFSLHRSKPVAPLGFAFDVALAPGLDSHLRIAKRCPSLALIRVVVGNSEGSSR